MIMNKITAFSLLIAVFTSATALEKPAKSPKDSRMQYLNYNANDVTLIKAKVGFSTVIKFAQDERILDIATGFADGWNIKDSNNVIYLKPITVQQGEAYFEPNAKDWKTNLLVTTNKYHYAFDLELAEKNDNAYVIRFSYPNEARKKRQEAEKIAKAKAKAKAKERKQEKINAKLDELTLPRNWDYFMRLGKNSSIIAPSVAYDDGLRTYFAFEPTTSIPAIFYYEGGKEMMSNVSTRKYGKYTLVIVHKTAQRFIFRRGDMAVGVINKGFGKTISDNNTTTQKTIIREVK